MLKDGYQTPYTNNLDKIQQNNVSFLASLFELTIWLLLHLLTFLLFFKVPINVGYRRKHHAEAPSFAAQMPTVGTDLRFSAEKTGEDTEESENLRDRFGGYPKSSFLEKSFLDDTDGYSTDDFLDVDDLRGAVEDLQFFEGTEGDMAGEKRTSSAKNRQKIKKKSEKKSEKIGNKCRKIEKKPEKIGKKSEKSEKISEKIEKKSVEMGMKKTDKQGKKWEKKEKNYENKETIENNGTEQIGINNKRFCRPCGIYQTLRTKHCRHCNACVATYDHHCYFFGACIGEFNYAKFYIFLLMQTGTLLFDNFFAWSSFHSTFRASDWLLENFFFLILWSISLLSFCPFFALLAYHTYLTATGQTTWEHQSRTKINYLKLSGKKFPFSKGNRVVDIFENFKQRLGHRNPPSYKWTLAQNGYFLDNSEDFNYFDNYYYDCGC